MSNINYSDYDTLIKNNYQEIKNSNNIFLCNQSAINKNKKYFAITTNNLNKNNEKNTCLVGDNDLELTNKENIYIDENSYDISEENNSCNQMDKKNKYYYVYKTPLNDKKNCIKKENLNKCLIKSQITYFNDKINEMENKVIDINAEKKFLKGNINESSYINDYDIIKKNQMDLYYNEKANASLWTDFMRNNESKLDIRKKEYEENNYSFSNELIKEKCEPAVEEHKNKSLYTNREKVIQQQTEFNYKTGLIGKLNIIIGILVILFFITIIYYSDAVTKIRKEVTSNLQSFSNDLFS